MERLQRFEADLKQIAEMAGKPHEEVAEAILKVTTETPASLEEATQQVHERMELQAEVAAETKEESDTPFVQRWNSKPDGRRSSWSRTSLTAAGLSQLNSSKHRDS